MAASAWREAPDAFRYLDVDFRGGDARERTAALADAVAAVEHTVERVPLLVHWESGGLDMAWFKQVKDANRRLAHLDLKAAFVGLGGRGAAIAGMFNLRVGHERVRAFDDEHQAFAWLRENA